MNHSTLRIIFCVAVVLAMLMAPFTLEITPNGSAIAFGSHSGRKNKSLDSQPITRNTNWSEYKHLKAEFKREPYESRPVQPVPEPATILLVGGGLAGMAVLRKKFKK